MSAFTDFTNFVMQAGPFIWLQFLIAWVVAVLVLVNAILLLVRRGARAARLRTSIDAVLFWGGLTAILGFLGQWSGLHRASLAVMERGVVNPKFIMLGLGESLHTTVFGVFTLVIAAFLWFGLRLLERRRSAA